MSDLSRLLGDVYGASTPSAEDADVDPADPTAPTAVTAAADDPPAPPVESVGDLGGPAAPGWADEQVLDEAFAEWVPGPPPDASAEERGILDDVEPAETVAEAIDIDAWLGDDTETVAAAGVGTEERDITEALEAFVPAPEPVVDAPAEADLRWTRTSDDLLPRGRRARRLSLSLRR